MDEVGTLSCRDAQYPGPPVMSARRRSYGRGCPLWIVAQRPCRPYRLEYRRETNRRKSRRTRLVVPDTATLSDVRVREVSPASSEEGWSGALPAPSHYTYRWDRVDSWPGGLDAIHKRLGEAGWKLGDRVGGDLRNVFWAARDGHLLRVLGGVRSSNGAVRIGRTSSKRLPTCRMLAEGSAGGGPRFDPRCALVELKFAHDSLGRSERLIRGPATEQCRPIAHAPSKRLGARNTRHAARSSSQPVRCGRVWLGCRTTDRQSRTEPLVESMCTCE